INAISDIERTGEECRSKWSYLQSDVKNKVARLKKAGRATGGGVVALPDLTPIEEKVLSIIPTAATEGIAGGIESRIGHDAPASPEAASPARSQSSQSSLSSQSSQSQPASPPPTPMTPVPPQSLLQEELTQGGWVKSGKKRSHKEVVSSNEQVSIERQRLWVKEKRLEIKRQRLRVEEERLDVEKQRLELENEKLEMKR
ncbi:PREDICTED: myb/SANT-like DNA-binding domain-containing protein 4, partial [Priapulus caudatus]|uniref:Myb/SANT-like DNA-binding domain-containing protein 4 n=1 Tax=Priapulus caudatus TaxID=37621 RepID=A0ABM1F702_PRICU